VPRDSSVAPSTFGGTHSATLRDDSEDVPSTVDNFLAATGGGQWSAAGRWRRGVVRHRPAADGWATPAGGGERGSPWRSGSGGVEPGRFPKRDSGSSA